MLPGASTSNRILGNRNVRGISPLPGVGNVSTCNTIPPLPPSRSLGNCTMRRRVPLTNFSLGRRLRIRITTAPTFNSNSAEATPGISVVCITSTVAILSLSVPSLSAISSWDALQIVISPGNQSRRIALLCSRTLSLCAQRIVACGSRCVYTPPFLEGIGPNTHSLASVASRKWVAWGGTVICLAVGMGMLLSIGSGPGALLTLRRPSQLSNSSWPIVLCAIVNSQVWKCL